jgi:hypothetical protein
MSEDQPVSIEIVRIEHALRKLLAAVDADAAENPALDLDGDGIVAVMARARRTSVLDKILDRPVAMAYRLAIEAIGDHLLEVCANEAENEEAAIKRVMDTAGRVADGDAMKTALLVRWWGAALSGDNE